MFGLATARVPGTSKIIFRQCSKVFSNFMAHSITSCQHWKATMARKLLTSAGSSSSSNYITELECGPMPNLMVALPNIGGALCSTPQSLADAHY